MNTPVSLWVVATPIGNREDIPTRARRILGEVDQVLAEDTRHTGRLLDSYGIEASLFSLQEHNERQRVDGLIEQMRAGRCFALVSDAGTPLLSDPGYRLVRACGDAGLRVAPVPGPSAAVAALSVAGLASDRFSFEGFLPARRAARRKRLGRLAQWSGTLIFFESPHRIAATLTDLAAVIGGEREACLCRELTKKHETVRRLPLAELRDWVHADSDQRRGELVLVVAGAGSDAAASETIPVTVRELYAELLQHLPPGTAAGILARHLNVDRKALYALGVDNDAQGDPPTANG